MVWKRTKRYFRKQVKRAYGAAKKRYATPGGFGRLAKDVSMLKGLINTEFKYHDQLGQTYTPTQADPLIVPLTEIPGNSSMGRTGNSIRLKSAQLQMRIERNPTTATPDANTVVVSLVLDRDPNLGTPAVTDIWTAGNPQSFRNIEVAHTNRFKIMVQRRFVIDGIHTRTAICSWFKRMNMVSRFNAATATSGSNNKLYMILRTDNTIDTDIQVFWNHRTKFIDN